MNRTMSSNRQESKVSERWTVYIFSNIHRYYLNDMRFEQTEIVYCLHWDKMAKIYKRQVILVSITANSQAGLY